MSRTLKEYKLFETECWDSLADRGADTSRAVSPDLGYDFSSEGRAYSNPQRNGLV